MTSAIDQLVEHVRCRISVLSPHDAATLRDDGALFVDTRPESQRHEFGGIAHAVPIERNHLEWRLDPTSAHRHPAVVEHHGAIVVFCQEGYSSSLAVATLVDLGVPNVHDLACGFAGWASTGLPIEPPAGPIRGLSGPEH